MLHSFLYLKIKKNRVKELIKRIHITLIYFVVAMGLSELVTVISTDTRATEPRKFAQQTSAVS